ncbi:hypothetical protein [Xenorhabdus sp. IM139775]|uniref:hypothetical protein n=1 Tax=Xenorhabdus sp. IM139775 TaxID=3025876 RepID=UPI0023592662|nr:hypothetical protein [Xenorhabdus sp. IM139775]MDC9592521.1 hypothetical protein [Xenorhabdus sp. IM139775]
MAPDNTKYSSAYGKEFDSCIQLNAKAEMLYMVSDLDMETELVDSHIEDLKNGFNWAQSNTYVTIKDSHDLYEKRRIIKLDD